MAVMLVGFGDCQPARRCDLSRRHLPKAMTLHTVSTAANGHDLIHTA